MSHFLEAALHPDAPCGLYIERTGDCLIQHILWALDSASRRRGLLEHSSLTAGEGLIIAPSQGIHTFGMRFAIDLIAAARDGRVVKVRAAVRPRRIVLAISAFAIVEMAAGAAGRAGVTVGDRLILRALPR